MKFTLFLLLVVLNLITAFGVAVIAKAQIDASGQVLLLRPVQGPQGEPGLLGVFITPDSKGDVSLPARG